MKANWIKVDKAKDVPDGEWLVILKDDTIHVMSIHPISNGRLAVIGNRFDFDMKPVTHYCELPEVPTEE